MSKVLLVTIQNNCNYGNRLQNYALQHTLENFGYHVDNLSLSDVKLADMSTSISLWLNYALRRMVSVVLKRFTPGVSIRLRRYRCARFSQKHIRSYLILTREGVNHYNFGEYMAAVAGSDQVWHNWKRIPDELDYYYLSYITPDRRIAYAPSFGFDEFPEEDIGTHREGILGMRALSCREKEGCALIHSLTGRTVRKVLDPTLLLSKEEWQIIEKKPRFWKSGKYIIQFMLGSTRPEYEYEINKIAEKLQARIVDLNDMRKPSSYGVSPEEFIWLIHHAEAVCTDSFHATVFSILFERELRVFKRSGEGFEHMFGRLNDLLDSLGLSHVVYDADVNNSCSTRLTTDSKKIMEMERQNSICFLKNILQEVSE